MGKRKGNRYIHDFFFFSFWLQSSRLGMEKGSTHDDNDNESLIAGQSKYSR